MLIQKKLAKLLIFPFIAAGSGSCHYASSKTTPTTPPAQPPPTLPPPSPRYKLSEII